uniref:G_PROTEIN_RECEP_F1_2 domain-containing protein n=1 Tax=Strongyloides stercoralis TaxID=6248 RepID=A0A0K0EL41_STRER
MDSINYIIFCGNAIFGIIFNFIAIYVTVKKSKNKDMEGYSKLMLLLFTSGIITSIFHGILRIHIIIINNTIIFVLEIFNTNPFNFLRNKFLIVLSIFFTYFTLTLPTSILITRYLVICKNIQINILKTTIIILFFTLIVLILSHGVWTIIKELPNDILSSWIEKENISSEVLTVNTIGIGSKIAIEDWYMLYIELILYFFINYITIIIIVIKYKRYINKLSNIMSEKTKKMNKECMLILILQSFAPIFCNGIPDFLFLFILIFKLSNGMEFLGTIILQLLNFTPVVNAILFLLLPSTNRKNIMKFLKIIYFKIKGKSIPSNLTSIKY